MQLRAAANAQDQGGFVTQPKDAPDQAPGLGARVSEQSGWLKVDQVIAGGAAERAGLTTGDLLVALSGERCTQDGLQELLARQAVGGSAELTLFRRDRLRTVQLPILAAPADTVDLHWLDDEALSDKVKQRRERWLSSSAKSGDG
jgi:predicted metalloprotease with PDZ domain